MNNATAVTRVIALLVLVGAVAAAALAVGAAPLDKTVAVVAQADGTFDPPEFWVDPGETLRIDFTNGDFFSPHDLVFELDAGRVVRTEVIPFGSERTLNFAAPATLGDYPYYCSAHRDQGMEGKLHVGPRPTATLTPAATTTPTRVPDVPYDTVIDDLQNPDGLAVYPDEALGSTILVSEGGTGGEPPYGTVPRPGNHDGRVLAIPVDVPDIRDVVVETLTNVQSPGGGVFGANHAIWWELDDPATDTAAVTLVAVAGGPGHAVPGEGAKVLMVDDEGIRSFADTLAYEAMHNPDGVAPGTVGFDSDPRRLVPDPNGDYVYVVDTAANDILRLDPVTMELSTFAVFAPIGPDRLPAMPADVVLFPFRDGSVDLLGVYVSLRVGDVAGAGQIRLLIDRNRDGDALDDADDDLVVVDGLTTPGDIAWSDTHDRVGKYLYISESALDRLSAVQFILDAGVVLLPTADPNATMTPATPLTPEDFRLTAVPVATSLYGIRGMAFDASDYLYVSVFGWTRGGRIGAPTDRVVRIPAARLVPPTTPTPTAATPTATTPIATPTPGTPSPGATTAMPTATLATSPPPAHHIFLPATARSARVTP